LAVRMLRLLSTLLGALTVVFTYLLTKQLGLSDPAALLSSILLALNPKFLLLSASVSNDIAVICLATLSLALSVRILRRPVTVRQAFVLGLVVGLAALSKTSGLGLGLPAIVAVIWSAVDHFRGKATVRILVACSVAMAVGVLVIMGGLWAWQWTHYGNPLAWDVVKELNRFAQRDELLTPLQILGLLPTLIPTLWRINATVPQQSIGDVIGGMLLGLAALGWVIGMARKRFQPILMLLPVGIAGSVIALLPWMQQFGGTEDSRLLPVVFSCMAILTAVGLQAIFPRVARRWCSAGVVIVSLAWAAVVPAVLIAPMYPAFTPLPASAYVDQVPATEFDHLPQTPIARFDNGIEMEAATIENKIPVAGEGVRVDVVWRVVRPVLQPYAVDVAVFGLQGQSLGKWNGRPLNGKRSTKLWQVGDVYRDIYTVTLAETANDTPSVASVNIGWNDADPPYRVATLIGSDALSAKIGDVKIHATNPPVAPAQHPVDAQFGGVFRLDGYDIDGDQLTLHWRALRTVPQEYQLFVHVVDPQGAVLSQADGPMPLPADMWEMGEQVLDRRAVHVLTKAQGVVVGIYDLASGDRLSALRGDGSAWPDNGVFLRTDAGTSQ
jgi:Dolichyl-phosphate-mannose-protein mannosyltransferase